MLDISSLQEPVKSPSAIYLKPAEEILNVSFLVCSQKHL